MIDEQIFDQVVQLPVGKRAAFLASECKDQPELRTRIEALIAAHEQADSLLDTEAMAVEETSVERPIHQTIGDFEIIRELGRGGMGVVYEARQKSLKRRVALKVLSSGLGLSSKAILRFRREAEAAGKLHHTNIVPIYTTGEDKGIHYYAMELIDGPSLDAVIEDLRKQKMEAAEARESDADVPSWLRKTALYDATGPAPARTDASSVSTSSTVAQGSRYFDHVATMIAEVADALEHAHEHGVIHRDIKPSNLLLAPDGRLSVNDFGLARMLEQPGMTMSGEFVGSPLYMSPEQITAGRVTIDHRTDIYSLGATLYELLSLRPPFPGQSRDQVLSQILHKEPVSTRKINRKVPTDLDTICMKAIEKDPDQRYQTAGQLAKDLRAYVNRHSISIRRQGPVARIAKLARRNPLATSFLAFVCAVTVFGVTAWWQRHVARIEDIKVQIIEKAMYGEFDEAKQLLQEAEAIGLEKGWRELLLGQILLHEGDQILAYDHLVEAALKLPNEPAANSLLAVSYYLIGREDEYMLRLRDVYESRPKTFLGKLFKGYALHWMATDEAVELLNEVIDEKPTYTAARSFRGEALMIQALDMNDRTKALELAISAKNDFEAVLTIWGKNEDVAIDLIDTELALAVISDGLNDQESAERYLRMAGDRVRSNESKLLSMSRPLYSSMSYHYVSNKDEKFAAFLDEHGDQLTHPQRSDQRGYFEVKAPARLFGQESIAVDRRVQLGIEIHAASPRELRSLTTYVPVFTLTDSPKSQREDLVAMLTRDLDSRLGQHSGIYLLLDCVALRLFNGEQQTLYTIAKRIRLGYYEYLIGQNQRRGITISDNMLGNHTL